MNPMNKSALVQALGYGLASAAATLAGATTAKRSRSQFSPLGFLSGRRRFQTPFGQRALTGALYSTPLLGALIGGRSLKRDLLRGALLGLSAGAGSLAAERQRRGRAGSGLTIVGRLLAGGLVAAAASRLFSRTWREQRAREPHTHEAHTQGARMREPRAQEQSGA